MVVRAVGPNRHAHTRGDGAHSDGNAARVQQARAAGRRDRAGRHAFTGDKDGPAVRGNGRGQREPAGSRTGQRDVLAVVAARSRVARGFIADAVQAAAAATTNLHPSASSAEVFVIVRSVGVRLTIIRRCAAYTE